MKYTLDLPNAGRLAFLAAEVCIEAPVRQGQAFAAYVPWDLIHEIRKELDRAGWPWREAHANCAKLKKASADRARIEREYK